MARRHPLCTELFVFRSFDVAVGAALTVAPILLWMHLSLLDECHLCVERAVASGMAEHGHNDRDEMKLYAAFGTELLYARGPYPWRTQS